MKFSLGWLKDHLDTECTLDEITDALTDLGLEVENVENPGDVYKDFTVCKVKEAKQHPNADRLKVCTLEVWPDGPDGKTEFVQAVCGAPNARTGLIGIYAPLGSFIPGSGSELKKGVIRGVESFGMLCSEREMELSDEHDGIIDLPSDTPLGAKFSDIFGLNETVVEIAVTPNRPDALGIRGIARDLAARGLGTLKDVDFPTINGEFKSPIGINIDDDAQMAGCPLFMGRMIRGVKNGPSPQWLQKRLKAIGLRPISILVDITNYITYEHNRPLHAFDADKVQGNLRIHFAKGGETITALDGETHEFQKGMMIISDDEGPESIAGLMGGEVTGCTDNTVNVFVESALWDPVLVAETGRKLKITSDARYRFERGVDPAFTQVGLDLATSMILDLCGGIPSDIIYDGKEPTVARSLRIHKDRTEKLIGMEIEIADQVEFLEKLGFKPVLDGDYIKAEVPSWRPDIGGEIDLVEEIGRLASLTRLRGSPLPSPTIKITSSTLTQLQKREQIARRTMANLGYNECVTYSFVDRETAEYFQGNTPLVNLENPISSEMDVMRPDLLPGLLKAVVKNQARGNNDLALFEIGPVFHGPDPEQQNIQVCGVLVGSVDSLSPHAQNRDVDLFDAKADLELLLNAIGKGTRFRLERHQQAGHHPARTGGVFLKPGDPLGWYGELHPKVKRKLKISGKVVCFSLLLEKIPFPRKSKITRDPIRINDLQPIERDFSFIVADQVEASAITKAINGSSYRNQIHSVHIFDEFIGPQAEKQFSSGHKSLAFRIKFYPEESRDQENFINQLTNDIEQRVTKATNGILRQI